MIYSVFDERFRSYGRVIHGFDGENLCQALRNQTPIPEGTAYVPEDPCLMAVPERTVLERNIFGGLPIQIGWCNGHNTKLNCLEYHRSSELNIGATEFILLLGEEKDIVAGVYHTEKIQAFRVPANLLVEIYATTLHYAPCQTDEHGFQVCVVLPKGTNEKKPDIAQTLPEDSCLFAANKWLLAHRTASEATQGAYVGLEGENIDISSWN